MRAAVHFEESFMIRGTEKKCPQSRIGRCPLVEVSLYFHSLELHSSQTHDLQDVLFDERIWCTHWKQSWIGVRPQQEQAAAIESEWIREHVYHAMRSIRSASSVPKNTVIHLLARYLIFFYDHSSIVPFCQTTRQVSRSSSGWSILVVISCVGSQARK